jgi:hypothetical protein
MTFIDNIKPLKISAAGDQRERFFKKMTFSTDSLPHTIRTLIIELAKYIKTYIIYVWP